MVLKLLVLRRRRAEHGASGLHEARPHEVEMLVDQEVLLLGAERDLDLFLGQVEALHEALRSGGERLHGTQQRGLLVERFAGVRAERGRDAQGSAVAVALDERRAGRIPGGVAARFERGADAARREAGGVRFADDQVLAGEGLDGLAVLDFEEGVVLFGGRPGERLEPVRVVGGAA